MSKFTPPIFSWKVISVAFLVLLLSGCNQLESKKASSSVDTINNAPSEYKTNAISANGTINVTDEIKRDGVFLHLFLLT